MRLTGTITRRGVFILADGRAVKARFGRPWQASRGNVRQTVKADIDGVPYSGVAVGNNPVHLRPVVQHRKGIHV